MIDYISGIRPRIDYPVTKLIDSGLPDEESLVVIFMGDGFTAERYENRPHPDTLSVLELVEDAMATMLSTPPFSFFADLFSVYVIHVDRLIHCTL